MKRFTQTVSFRREGGGEGNIILLLLFTLLSVIYKGQADQTVFYDKANYEGSTFTLTATGGCYNLKSKWAGNVSSAQVLPDSCMIAWKNENCNGISAKLLPNASETMDMTKMGFDKQIRSISLCTEISFRPAMEIGDRMWNPTRARMDLEQRRNRHHLNTDWNFGVIQERVELNFYDESNHRGSILTVTSNGDCYTFKRRWTNRISSLDSGGRCLNIWDTPDCQGAPATLPTGEDENARNLKLLGYDKRVKSVQLCAAPLVVVDKAEEQNESGGKKDSAADKFTTGNNPSKNDDDSFDLSEPDPSTEEDVRKASLVEHNNLRRLHGVPDLKWDFKLQHIAQSHAEWLAKHDKFEHSTNDDYGENIGGISISEKISSIKQSIHLWYNEIQNYNFDNPSFSVLSIKAGHFTQLIWKSTTHIGLGAAWNPRRQWYVVVCNYSPPGNFKGLYDKNVLPLVQKGT